MVSIPRGLSLVSSALVNHLPPPQEIMLAPEELTVVIDKLSRRGVHDHGERPGGNNSDYTPPGSGFSTHAHSHYRHDYA
jgi:hypothetical protein